MVISPPPAHCLVNPSSSFSSSSSFFCCSSVRMESRQTLQAEMIACPALAPISPFSSILATRVADFRISLGVSNFNLRFAILSPQIVDDDRHVPAIGVFRRPASPKPGARTQRELGWLSGVPYKLFTSGRGSTGFLRARVDVSKRFFNLLHRPSQCGFWPPT